MLADRIRELVVSGVWDSRVGANRDPHVLANGSIRGVDYVRGFRLKRDVTAGRD